MAFQGNLLIGNSAAAAFTPPTGNETYSLIATEDASLGVVRANLAIVSPNRDLMRIKSSNKNPVKGDPKSFRVFSRNVVFSSHVWDSTTSQVIPVTISQLLTMPEHVLITNALVTNLVARQRNWWGLPANLAGLIAGEV